MHVSLGSGGSGHVMVQDVSSPPSLRVGHEAALPSIVQTALDCSGGERVGAGAGAGGMTPSLSVKRVTYDPAISSDELVRRIGHLSGLKRPSTSPWNAKYDEFLLRLVEQNPDASWSDRADLFNEKNGTSFTSTKLAKQYYSLDNLLTLRRGPLSLPSDLIEKVKNIQRPPDSPWIEELDLDILGLKEQNPHAPWPTLMHHFHKYVKPGGTPLTADRICRRHHRLQTYSDTPTSRNTLVKLTPEEIQEVIDSLSSFKYRKSLWNKEVDREICQLKIKYPKKYGRELSSKLSCRKSDKTEVTPRDFDNRFYKLCEWFKVRKLKGQSSGSKSSGSKSSGSSLSGRRLSALSPQQIEGMLHFVSELKRRHSFWNKDLDTSIVTGMRDHPTLTWKNRMPLMPAVNEFRKPKEKPLTPKEVGERYRELCIQYLQSIRESAAATEMASTTTSSSSSSSSSGSSSSGSSSSGSSSSGGGTGRVKRKVIHGHIVKPSHSGSVASRDGEVSSPVDDGDPEQGAKRRKETLVGVSVSTS